MQKATIIDKKDPYAALRYKEFRSYLGMRFFFTFAYQMQAVIIGFHIYHLTKDPLALGLVGLCEAIPAISIALYGGYVADKSEKRGLLLKVFIGVFICSLVMPPVRCIPMCQLNTLYPSCTSWFSGSALRGGSLARLLSR